MEAIQDNSSSIAAPDEKEQQRRQQQHLIETCQGLVRSLAWKMYQRVPRRQIALEDLVAYGQIGLLEAARDFDPGRGNQFTTYAYHRIRGAIYDGLSQMSWFSRFAYHSGRYQDAAGEAET